MGLESVAKSVGNHLRTCLIPFEWMEHDILESLDFEKMSGSYFSNSRKKKKKTLGFENARPLSVSHFSNSCNEKCLEIPHLGTTL